MALYMFQVAYTPEEWATLVDHPQDRSQAVRAAVERLKGRLIGFYYCVGGEFDGVGLAELPDDTTALAITIASPNHLKGVKKMTKLFTVEEMMEAMRTAGSLVYQPVTS